MNDANRLYRNLTTRKLRSLFSIALAILCLGCLGNAGAAVVTWTGGSVSSDNWSTGSNWDTGTAPANNDSLVFNAAVGAGQITNNLVGRTFAQISFIGVGSSFFVYGNPITLTGGITQSSSGGANTVHFDITLATNNQTFAVTGSGVGSGLQIAGDINLNGRNLSVNVTDSGTELNLSGVISGTGNVTRGTGAGGLRLSGSSANTYVGTTTINGGYLFAVKANNVVSIPGDVVIGNSSGVDTLLMGSDNQFGASSDVTLRDGGILDNNNETNVVASLTFNDGGTVESTTGRIELAGPVNVIGSGVSNSIINGNLHLGSATRTFNVSDTAQTIDLEINGVISGGSSGSPFFFPSGVIKSGAGVLRFNAANTYSGATTINEGELRVNNDKALAGTGLVLNGSSGTFVHSNGVILLQNGISITNETLTLNSVNPLGALQDNGSCAWYGSVILSTNVVIETSSAMIIDGVISGAGGFTKIGGSTLTLSGTDANTYTGTTIVNAGTLQLDRVAFDGSIVGNLIVGDGSGSDVVRNLNSNQIDNNSHVIVNSSGLLDLNDVVEGIGSLEMTGGTVDSGTSSLVLFAGGLTSNPSSVIATINGALNLNGVVRPFDIASGTASPAVQINAGINSGGIAKTGNGNIRLAGANTYAGLTTVSNGFIQIANTAALGTTASGTVLAGGSLLLEGQSIVGEPLTNNSSSSRVQSVGIAAWSGNIVLNAELEFQPFGGLGTLDLSGVISGVGALTKSQVGTLILSGNSANTYTGITTVTAGILQLSKTTVNGTIMGDLLIGDGFGGVGADIVRLTLNNQIANSSLIHIRSSGLLDVNGHQEFTGIIDGSGRIDMGVGADFRPGNGSGSSIFSGVISGSGNLVKMGSSTWFLTGNNTYTAATTVDLDRLVVNGFQPQSPVVVEDFSTLHGYGTVGNLFVSGNLIPGDLEGINFPINNGGVNVPGILTCSNLAFSATGDLFVKFRGPVPGTYSQMNVRGTNALGNAELHVFSDFLTPVALGQTFTIINNDGSDAITGTFLGLPEGGGVNLNGYGYRISYVGGSGNDVVLTLTNIPTIISGTAISSGDGNHAIDPNECNDLNIVIMGVLGQGNYDITATLSTTTPGVIISQPYSAYPPLPVDGTSTNATPFQISTLPSFVCGTDIDLQLSVNSADGAYTMDFVQHTGESAPSPSRYDNSTLTAIPDVGSVDSTNTVAGFVGPLTKVLVQLHLTHTLDSDLTNISLIAPDGTAVLLSAANGGSGQHYGTNCSPDAGRTTFDDAAGTAITSGAAPFVGTFRPQSPLSAFNNNPTPNGDWRLRISDGFGGNLGTLRCWSLFLHGATCTPGSGACDLCMNSIVGAISAADPLQTNRWFRSEVVQSSCGAPQAWPGFGGTLTNYHYDAYTFTNTSAADACVTVMLQSTNNLMAAAYLNSFDPNNIASNYLGDADFSTSELGGIATFSCSIPAGATFVIAVNEVFANSGTLPYTLQLSGLPCPPPALAIDSVTNSNVRVHWPTSAGGYKLEATESLTITNWAPVTNEPIVASGRFNVTNSAVDPTNRFYRLKQQP